MEQLFERHAVPGYGKEFLDRIRVEKARLDNDMSLLVDGSLPDCGPFDHDDLTVSAAAQGSEGWKSLQLFHSLVLICRPRVVLELGTNVGISSAYIAAALSAGGNGGRIHTVDGSGYRVRLAKNLHEKLGLRNVSYSVGLFDTVLPDVLAQLPVIDFAFIDGQHQYEPTLRFFEAIRQQAPDGAVLVFDDILSYSEQMKRAWAKIRAHPRVYTFSEFGELGIVILGPP